MRMPRSRRWVTRATTSLTLSLRLKTLFEASGEGVILFTKVDATALQNPPQSSFALSAAIRGELTLAWKKSFSLFFTRAIHQGFERVLVLMRTWQHSWRPQLQCSYLLPRYLPERCCLRGFCLTVRFFLSHHAQCQGNKRLQQRIRPPFARFALAR